MRPSPWSRRLRPSFLIAALLLPPVAAAQDGPGKEAGPAPAAKSAPAARPAPDVDDVDAAHDDAPPREEIRQRAPSRNGALGVDTVLSADPGLDGSFRMRLSLLYFDGQGFPAKGSSNTFSGSVLGLAYTPHPKLETFLSARSTSNVNDSTHPEVLQTQGDLTVGLKAGHFVTRSFAAGLAVSAHLLSGLGEGSLAGSGTSVWFRGLGTVDLHRSETAPLRILFDLGYYVENSQNLYGDQPDELDIAQEWGLQIARYDRVTFGLAIEAPVSKYASPFLEYRLDTPLQVELTRKGEGSRDFAFGSFPHTLTPGVRAFPLPALALDAAVAIGLGDQPYTGVPATPPWLLLISASYTLDPRPVIVERKVEPQAPPPPPPPPEGTIAGRVVDAVSGQPIESAVVAYPKPLTAQTTDAGGRFESYRLPPRALRLRVSAKGYVAQDVDAPVAAGKATPLEVKLALDAKADGELVVKLIDTMGKSLAGTINVGGEKPVSGPATPEAPFTVRLPPGKYAVTGVAPTRLPRTLDAEITAGETTTLRIAVSEGTATTLVVIRKHSLRLKRQVHFRAGSAQLAEDSRELLDQVATVLQAHPEIRRVRIDGHTDNKGNRDKNVTLSADRARSVRSHLVSRGVSAERLTVKGHGPDKPIAPNFTERGRERNRRVELNIVERAP